MDLDISNIALWGQQQKKFLKRTTTGHTGIRQIAGRRYVLSPLKQTLRMYSVSPIAIPKRSIALATDVKRQFQQGQHNV